MNHCFIEGAFRSTPRSLKKSVQENVTSAGTCCWYPPEMLIEFQAFCSWDRQPSGRIPLFFLNIKSKKINVSCSSHREGWGWMEPGVLLAAFPSRLAFPPQQRSLRALGKKWGNWDISLLG